MPVCLNHLNLVVSDLDAAEAFFATYFAFSVRSRHARLVVLDGVGGFVLVLMRARDSAPDYPSGFHIGFLVEDEAAVDAEYARLVTTGLDVAKPPREMRGTYGFYFTALDGVLFEIAAR